MAWLSAIWLLLTFNPILLFDDVGQQACVGKALVAGRLEIIIPMSKQLAQVQVLELCSQGLIYVLLEAQSW